MKRSVIMGCCCVILLGAAKVRADLMTPAYESQLEAWLGEGDLTLTHILTKATGDGLTSGDFHAAADGQGRTFTLISADLYGDGDPILIGGYNPESWDSDIGWRLSSPTDRTAFLFNLTTLTTQAQRTDVILGIDFGRFQTRNELGLGPSFGGPDTAPDYADLLVDRTLETGSTRQFAYGPPGPHFGMGAPGIDGREPSIPGDRSPFYIVALDVYSISPVPEPSSLFLWTFVAATCCVTATRVTSKRRHGLHHEST